VPQFGPGAVNRAKEMPVGGLDPGISLIERVNPEKPRGESPVLRLVGIAGSLRTGSFNAALLRSAVNLIPEGAEIEVGSIRDIPLYNGDVEASDGIPPPVQRLKEQIAAADGLLLVTPEYNNSIPGVFKNAIDWVSRPASDIPRVFGGKPVAVIGASPGGFGTILSQNAWLPVLRTLGANPWFGGRLLVSRASSVFDEFGALRDAPVEERLREFLRGFTAFVAAAKAPGSGDAHG
jgi:chromate reductase, NAD(P)H dehydrogenase (quinone)